MFDQGLVAALNHLLSGANWAQELLLPFAGRHVLFEMPPFRLGLSVTDLGMLQHDPLSDQPDVTLRLPINTPLLLPQGIDKVMAEAIVEGNADFANTLSFVLRNLRWDLENDLSKLVGDIAAHRLTNHFNRLVDWQQQSSRNLAENLAEYWIHERHLLIAAAEFAKFRAEIALLTAKSLQLADRISRSTL